MLLDVNWKSNRVPWLGLHNLQQFTANSNTFIIKHGFGKFCNFGMDTLQDIGRHSKGKIIQDILAFLHFRLKSKMTKLWDVLTWQYSRIKRNRWKLRQISLSIKRSWRNYQDILILQVLWKEWRSWIERLWELPSPFQLFESEPKSVHFF